MGTLLEQLARSGVTMKVLLCDALNVQQNMHEGLCAS